MMLSTSAGLRPDCGAERLAKSDARVRYPEKSESMRKPLLLFALAVCLTSCTPNQNPVYRAREARQYPDPTLGTENGESQWYKTQILAAPSQLGSAGAPVDGAPAKLPVTRVPAHRSVPGAASPASQGAGAVTGSNKTGL